MLSSEKTKRELDHKVKLFQALSRLEVNADFKLLIGTGFCRDEVVRIVSASNTIMNSDLAAVELSKAKAGPTLSDYFERIKAEGPLAVDQLRELQQISDAED